MNEIIKQYCNQKFMFSMIFDKSIVSGMSKMRNKKNEERFFKAETLEYLKDTIIDKEIKYDNYKLNLIKEYLFGYIAVYGNDETKNNIINLCKEILHLMIDEKQSGIKKFYQYEWQLRTNNAIKEYHDKKQQIDKSISLDYTYINALLKNQSMTKLKEDINCLLSLNAFTVECPVLFMNPVFLHNVRKLLELNKNSTIYEVQALSCQISNFIKNLEMDNEEIFTICQDQSILSLIFCPNFEDALNEIDKNIGDTNFYNTQRFQLFKRIIIEGSEKCIFDNKKKEYVYILLAKFRHNLDLSNAEQNDIKIALNHYEDEEYNQKNNAFYINCYQLHHTQRFNHCNEKILCTDYGKSIIDEMIYYDSYVFKKLLDPDLDITELATFKNSIYSINYIINCFPVITENPIYLERISNLLELNDMIYSVNSETSESKEENRQTLKKIKKLQK